MSNVILITPKKASAFFNVTETTLRDWADNGKIQFTKTKGGHRRYQVDREEYLRKNKKAPTNPYAKIIYTRVSSHKQQQDLFRQIQFLQKQYPDHKVISDIGSGLNYERKGFKTVLEQLFRGNIEVVMVAYRDRWCRFGFELFQWMFRQHGAQLMVHNSSDQSPELEMAEDILSIITVFSAKYHGSRKYNLDLLPKDPSLSQQGSKETI